MKPAEHRPILTRRRSEATPHVETRENAEAARLDAVDAARDIRRAVERVERGDCVGGGLGVGWPAYWWMG